MPHEMRTIFMLILWMRKLRHTQRGEREGNTERERERETYLLASDYIANESVFNPGI